MKVSKKKQQSGERHRKNNFPKKNLKGKNDSRDNHVPDVKNGKQKNTSTNPHRKSDNSQRPFKKKTHNSRYKKKDDDEEDGSDFEEVTDDWRKNKMEGDGDSEQSESENDSDDDESERKDARKLVAQQNRKKKKSGGFQSMGLSHNVYKGVIRKGYKIPTPIQRKTIPVIIDGKDVVAMARTGSGKTAAFLIPMFEKLQNHSAVAGARALVLSPTRELALQTLKFAKELGKFTGLRAAVVLGGDRMEDQFSALHENPDIIIATPGRFMHVVVEMNLKLKSVQYIVFDEADRLFEMGFQEQMTEILNRLPDSRQTLLFSATLPKLLVDFAKAGLHDPTLIRLDVDIKLSEQLKLSFLQCRQNDKLATLLYMLQNVIPQGEQTVVFAATKHHVEYLKMILEQTDISCCHIYSSLDPTARKINIAKFQHRKVSVLIVTDLAARGIDIPLLDNVINYHFPAQPKLFIHRVGRVARAGRSGVAYSLVSPDELPYVMDLHVFLGRAVKFVPLDKPCKDEDGLYGQVPQSVMDDAVETLRSWHEHSYDIKSMVKVCNNAFGHYVRSRPSPAQESVKRVKDMEKLGQQIGVHPLFGKATENQDTERQKLLNALKSYKSNTTIFEINSTAKTSSFSVMKMKRKKHEGVVASKLKNVEEFSTAHISQNPSVSKSENVDNDQLQGAFGTVIGGKRRREKDTEREELPPKQKKNKTGVRDEENYISYRPADYQTEQGLRLGSSFDQEVSGAMLDLTGDDQEVMKRSKFALRWDRKKKKYVRENNEDPKKKKIRTESGAWISASYKSHAYKDWLDKTKRDTAVAADEDENNDDDEGVGRPKKKNTPQRQTSQNRLTVLGGGDPRKRHRKGTESDEKGGKKNKFKNKRYEIKRPEQVMKARKMKAKKAAFQNQRQRLHSKNRSMAQRMKKS